MSVKTALAGGAAATLFLASLPAVAGDLVYQPRNPSFGGDPFNSQHLLGTAEAQRDQTTPSFDQPSAIERFGDDLERRILSASAREITDRIFGEGEQDSGEFSVGNNLIQFERIGEDVRLVLTDTDTGAETVLTVPAPQF